MTRSAGYVAALVVILCALVALVLLAGSSAANLLPRGELW